MNEKLVWNDSLNPRIIASTEGIILYGAGLNAAKLLVHFKRRHPELRFLCIADADITKQGNKVFDVAVVAPEDLKLYDSNTVIIVTPDKYCLAITENLNKLGFYNLLYYHALNSRIVDSATRMKEKINENRLLLDRLLKENNEKITYVREALQHDEKSLDVFNAKLSSKYYGIHIPLEALQEGNQYYPNDIIHLSGNEVFVDCGALDGGSVFDFIRRAKSYDYIYSFEPDQLQYIFTKMMLNLYGVERYELHNLGVYNEESRLAFSSKESGDSRIIEEGELMIQVTSLDTILLGKANRPTYIKMDVEGSEMEALKGSYNIIKRDFPKLAISVYHGNTHIYEVPYWIKTNFPKYKIYMRQHHNINETVCYAIR